MTALHELHDRDLAADRLMTGSCSLAALLQALSDPVRLEIVIQLADGSERPCGGLSVRVSKSTCSHHFRILREAGVIETRAEGKARLNRLRREEIEDQFPGLLDAILGASRR